MDHESELLNAPLDVDQHILYQQAVKEPLQIDVGRAKATKITIAAQEI